MKKLSILAVLFCLAAVFAGADSLIMKDGSVLVGDIQSVSDNLIEIRTPFGLFTVERNRVESVELNPRSAFFDTQARSSGAGEESTAKDYRFEALASVSINFLNTFEISPAFGIRYYPLRFLGVSAFAGKSIYNAKSFYAGATVDGIVSLNIWKPMLSLGFQGGVYSNFYSEGYSGFAGVRLSVALLRFEVGKYILSIAEFAFLRNFMAVSMPDPITFEVTVAQVGFLF